jgi:hypothetical protein
MPPNPFQYLPLSLLINQRDSVIDKLEKRIGLIEQILREQGALSSGTSSGSSKSESKQHHRDQVVAIAPQAECSVCF